MRLRCLSHRMIESDSFDSGVHDSSAAYTLWDQPSAQGRTPTFKLRGFHGQSAASDSARPNSLRPSFSSPLSPDRRAQREAARSDLRHRLRRRPGRPAARDGDRHRAELGHAQDADHAAAERSAAALATRDAATDGAAAAHRHRQHPGAGQPSGAADCSRAAGIAQLRGAQHPQRLAPRPHPGGGPGRGGIVRVAPRKSNAMARLAESWLER